MNLLSSRLRRAAAVCCCVSWAAIASAQPTVPRAFIDGTGPGWTALTSLNFTNVNCYSNTWNWTNGMLACTGEPVGVLRSTVLYTNFEVVLQWHHQRAGGNSGVFVWASPESIRALEQGEGRLPAGIEVQILDLAYTEQYENHHKKKADWFTTHGDVFPTGSAEMNPFPPTSPNGKRSFPSKNLTKPAGEWNHYYIRCLNGEVRLWVNGEEVSGGTGCRPAAGYFCLESEGAPVEFRELRLRVLP